MIYKLYVSGRVAGLGSYWDKQKTIYLQFCNFILAGLLFTMFFFQCNFVFIVYPFFGSSLFVWIEMEQITTH